MKLSYKTEQNVIVIQTELALRKYAHNPNNKNELNNFSLKHNVCRHTDAENKQVASCKESTHDQFPWRIFKQISHKLAYDC